MLSFDDSELLIKDRIELTLLAKYVFKYKQSVRSCVKLSVISESK